MKLLSKIAKIATQVFITWTGLEPALRASFPDKSGKIIEIRDTILEIRDIIITVEEVAAASTLNIPGDEKLQMAGPLVARLILRSALVADRKVKDENLFTIGITKISGGMADVLNSLDDNLDEQRRS